MQNILNKTLRNIFLLTAVLGLTGCANAYGQSQCDHFFVDGKPPVVTNSDQKLCLKGYALAYSDQTRGNSYAAEYLIKDQVEKGKLIRRYGTFDSRDPIIRDYRNSGYDRGHMTPSGDMGDYESQVQTFQYQNLVPQTRRLNSGKWNWIENQVRQIAIQYGSVYVVTGPYFQGTTKTIGQHHIWVPYATWKAIYIPKLQKAGVYFCINEAEPVCYVQTVSFFTQRTKIDPFPGLDQAIKDTKLALPKMKHKKNK
ncbi:DNA/RNA non-specific endonuclease [Commensalibacter oyaizuii]|uniref:Endonuclease n=1 Tax=Commensalibacter oyaizuii TaxID=3043873 RepID=A0ABT6PZV7_9PROT|nr:DNA/RNA non-specific endonuclease [Commensalibacter sp. TBRC 16381]MDI2089774.1 DNA/RNA non-specific endonuclease [Commensalibacter sp. TBRC 16381]